MPIAVMTSALKSLLAVGAVLTVGSAGATTPDLFHVGVQVEKSVGDGKLYSHGSGVLIGDGLVLTAAHVVNYNRADARVTVLVSGRRVRGTLEFTDADGGVDIALIKIDRPALPVESRNLGISFCNRDPGINKPVIVESLGEETRSMTVAAPDKPDPKAGEWTTTLASSYHHGSSGGGVFDADKGCLLGIIVVEITGRVRPDAPFINMTRFAPAPDLSRFLQKYQARRRQEKPAGPVTESPQPLR